MTVEKIISKNNAPSTYAASYLHSLHTPQINSKDYTVSSCLFGQKAPNDLFFIIKSRRCIMRWSGVRKIKTKTKATKLSPFFLNCRLSCLCLNVCVKKCARCIQLCTLLRNSPTAVITRKPKHSDAGLYKMQCFVVCLVT